MGWGEAYRLTCLLMNDPSSQVGASFAGWEHPVSHEWIAMKRHYDAFVGVNTDRKRRPQLMPAPWDPKPKPFGTPMSRAEFDEIVARHRQSHTPDQRVEIRGG